MQAQASEPVLDEQQMRLVMTVPVMTMVDESRDETTVAKG